jgi:hypothetical protein
MLHRRPRHSGSSLDMARADGHLPEPRSAGRHRALTAAHQIGSEPSSRLDLHRRWQDLTRTLTTKQAARYQPWLRSGTVAASDGEFLLRTPVDRVGRLPNLAGGPARPATRETLHCCDVHNHA